MTEGKRKQLTSDIQTRKNERKKERSFKIKKATYSRKKERKKLPFSHHCVCS